LLNLLNARTLIEQLGIEKFPAACLHGAIVYDNEGNIDQATTLEPNFVLGVTELMKKHNKTTMLYVADWVAMASLEQGGKTDWEAVSRGFDPCVRDARETDFLEQVLAGKEHIGKVSPVLFRLLSRLRHRSLEPRPLTLRRSLFPDLPSYGRGVGSRVP
jgi:hydroxymethylpyrimidine pyrophosphatase-like HAD family hydrolase